MSIIRNVCLAMLPALLVTGIWTRADASMDIRLQDQGDDLRVSYSGSIDTEDLMTLELNVDPLSRLAYDEFLSFSGSVYQTRLTDIDGPRYLSGSSFYMDASTWSGDSFGFNSASGRLYFPVEYVSGASIVGSAVFAGANVADLNLSAPSLVWTFGDGETITMRVVPTAVPEIGADGAIPALVLVSGALAALAGRRRRQA